MTLSLVISNAALQKSTKMPEEKNLLFAKIWLYFYLCAPKIYIYVIATSLYQLIN